MRNPFAGGRTILHFRGAGQTTSVWIGSTLLGKHKGGYDEFAFDITDAVAQQPLVQRTKGVPLTVLCDNSPDRDRVPSDLSDFCLFGGLYRGDLAFLQSELHDPCCRGGLTFCVAKNLATCAHDDAQLHCK